MVGDFQALADFQTQKKPPTLATFDYVSDFYVQKFSQRVATFRITGFGRLENTQA